jgi:hypothetical protein
MTRPNSINPHRHHSPRPLRPRKRASDRLTSQPLRIPRNRVLEVEHNLIRRHPNRLLMHPHRMPRHRETRPPRNQPIHAHKPHLARSTQRSAQTHRTGSKPSPTRPTIQQQPHTCRQIVAIAITSFRTAREKSNRARDSCCPRGRISEACARVRVHGCGALVSCFQAFLESAAAWGARAAALSTGKRRFMA